MKAQITSIKPTLSKYGGKFYYVFFKDDNGKSFKTCLFPTMRNFPRWKSVMKVGAILTNLKIKEKNLIDADSWFNFIGIQPVPNRKESIKKNSNEYQPKLF